MRPLKSGLKNNNSPNSPPQAITAHTGGEPAPRFRDLLAEAHAQHAQNPNYTSLINSLHAALHNQEPSPFGGYIAPPRTINLRLGRNPHLHSYRAATSSVHAPIVNTPMKKEVLDDTVASSTSSPDTGAKKDDRQSLHLAKP